MTTRTERQRRAAHTVEVSSGVNQAIAGASAGALIGSPFGGLTGAAVGAVIGALANTALGFQSKRNAESRRHPARGR